MHLVINSYGAVLSRENNLFSISTSEGEQRFAPDTVKSISVHKAAKVTSDAILLAVKHEVEILFVNDLGNPEGRVWSVQYGSISSIRKAQLNFLYSPASLEWVKALLMHKLDGQIALLLAFQPDKSEALATHNKLKSVINSINDYKNKIWSAEAEFLSDISSTLRGWEGAAGRRYFEAIATLLPPEYAFQSRDRRPAKDPFNSMLNYAYGMLYGKVEGALIKAGLDPYVGIFHRDDYNRPALVYDIIERYRTWMDYVVISLSRAEAIPTEAFNPQHETGALLLGPLAKRILIQSVHDYLDEIITLGSKTQSRAAHLTDDMHKLAKTFLTSPSDDKTR